MRMGLTTGNTIAGEGYSAALPLFLYPPTRLDVGSKWIPERPFIIQKKATLQREKKDFN